jgi:hypothetical protein
LDFETILALIGALASGVTILGGFYKLWQIGIKGAWTYLKSRVARTFWNVPKSTLVILPEHEHRLWWHMGGQGGQPAMQIVGDFYLTNISPEEILVPKTFMTAYYCRWGLIPVHKKVEGHVFVRLSQGETFGGYHIPPRSTTDCRADWWVQPPIKTKGKKLRGRVCFIDQFGNEHWTPLLTWHYT